MHKFRTVIAVSVVLANLGGCATQIGSGSFIQAIPAISQFVLNGLSVQPVTAFPTQAFGGLPAVRSLADMSALAKGAKQFAQEGHQSVAEGNMETALLNWYIAQHLAARSMAITQASIQAIGSVDKNGDTLIAPRSLIMLPVADLSNTASLAALIEQDEFVDYAQFDWAGALKLAGGTLETLGQALKGASGNHLSSSSTQYATNTQPQMIPKDELPLDMPVRLNNGIYVERKSDVFVIYNGGDQPSTLPLSKIGYVPPMAKSSPARVGAVPLIRKMSDSRFHYAEHLEKNTYRTVAYGCELLPPNKLSCSKPVESFYFDSEGRLVRDPASGVIAYKNNPSFKIAIDTISGSERSPIVKNWRSGCQSSTTGVFYKFKIVGPGAEILKLYCIPHDQYGRNGIQTTDFIISEQGLVKTYATLMNEKETRDKMTNSIRDAQSLSDLVAMVPVVGSGEDLANCLNLEGSAIKSLSGPSGYNKTMAQLAGWKPEPVTSKSVMGTAVNCLGALPVVGQAAKLSKGASKILGNTQVAAYVSQNADKVGNFFKLFDASLIPGGYAKSVAEIERLFPNNVQLVQLIKRVNDSVLRSNGMSSTLNGLSAF